MSRRLPIPLEGPARRRDSVHVGVALTVVVLMLAWAAARLFAKWGF